MERNTANIPMMHFAKPLRTLLLAVLVAMTFSACDLFEARDRTYQGPTVLEFSPTSGIVNEGDGPVATNVQLIGPQRDSALPVSYVVDDSSTAVEGTHYSLGSTNTQIDAGSSSASVTVNVLDNDANDGGNNFILYLSLQESQGVEPAENLKTFTLTIRGADE